MKVLQIVWVGVIQIIFRDRLYSRYLVTPGPTDSREEIHHGLPIHLAKDIENGISSVPEQIDDLSPKRMPSIQGQELRIFCPAELFGVTGCDLPFGKAFPT